MSSVPGRCPDNSLDSNTSSAMSSASVNMNPPGHGGLETMSRPYSNGIPDRYAHPHLDTHPAIRAQQPQRLPPPQRLEAGAAPYAPDSFRLQSQSHHYFRPPPLYQNSSTPSTVSQSQSQSQSQISPPLPSPSQATHPSPISHHTYPPRDLARTPQILAPLAIGGSEPSPVPRLSRFPQSTETVQSQPPPVSPYHRHPEAAIPLDASRLERRNPAVASATQPESSMAAQPSLWPHRADSGSSTSSTSIATRIPNLLDAYRVRVLADLEFVLKMRQQPNAARACGFGDRDRRVIDPPPIVELKVQGSSLTPAELRTYLRYESYVMSCAIYDESGTRDSSYMPEEYHHQRRLMGSLVSTPFVGQDETGQEGCFFCFSDLSCRTPGTFRLKFTLMMIDPSRAGVVRHFPILAEIKSEPFKVYSAKEFPGMVASSSLAKRLKEQGCIISIKKGNERVKNARGQDDLSDNDDDEDGESSHGQRKRRK